MDANLGPLKKAFSAERQGSRRRPTRETRKKQCVQLIAWAGDARERCFLIRRNA